MVKNQIIVESVVFQGLGVRATASKYGVSPAWVSTLVARYRAEGPSAFEPRSKRPHSNKLATPPAVEDRIIELRKELSDIGTDNGADTIHTHLEREFAVVPSISTIQRLNGSMAVYAYTNDQSLEVLDLDLSCTEAAFPALLNALEAHSMSANVTNWHVLQVRDESMQVEIDSEETWMAGINLVPRALDLYGLSLHIIDRESLLELYRRGADALKGTSDPSMERKFRKLTRTYLTLELISPP